MKKDQVAGDTLFNIGCLFSFYILSLGKPCFRYPGHRAEPGGGARARHGQQDPALHLPPGGEQAALF